MFSIRKKQCLMIFIIFVTNYITKTKNGERNWCARERGKWKVQNGEKRESGKWEIIAETLTLSVTSFHILSFVPCPRSLCSFSDPCSLFLVLVTSIHLHFLMTVTYIPLFVKILFMIFLISWKSGRKSGLSSQHCFISSRSSSTPVINSDTVGRKGGNSPFCTLSTISIRFNSSRNWLAFVYKNQCSLRRRRNLTPTSHVCEAVACARLSDSSRKLPKTRFSLKGKIRRTRPLHIGILEPGRGLQSNGAEILVLSSQRTRIWPIEQRLFIQAQS